MSNIKPKVILITGCSSGFGLLIAARLAARGDTVFATMRDLVKQSDLLAEVKKRGGHVNVLRLDVTDKATVQNAVGEIFRQTGRIDVLVNNAGFGMGGFFEDLSDEDIRVQMEVNFFGAQNVCREVIPIMRRQGGGTIVNITSIAGLYALPGFGAYNASKWALEGFSESLYYEMKPFGIKVCLIEPGTYKTKIFFDNKRYAKNFNNRESPYYKYSQWFKKRVDENVEACKKNPEDIAALAEKLIAAKNPPFRNFPDSFARMITALKRILPFRIFSGLLYRALFGGIK